MNSIRKTERKKQRKFSQEAVALEDKATSSMDEGHIRKLTDKEPQKKKLSIKTRALRALFWGVLAVVLLPVLFSVLLYIPAVQNHVITLVENRVNSGGGIRMSLGEVRLGFPLRLKVKDAVLMQSEGDTLVRAGELSIGVKALPLLQGLLESDRVFLRDISFSLASKNGSKTAFSARKLALGPLTASLGNKTVVAGTLYADRGGFEYIAPLKKNIPKAPPFEWHFRVHKVDLRDFPVKISLPSDSLWVDAPFRKFLADEVYVAVDSLDIRSRHVRFSADNALYANTLQASSRKSIDYRRICAEEISFEAENFTLGKTLLAMDIRSTQMLERSGAKINALRGSFRLDEGKLITVKGLRFISPKSDIRGDLRLPLKIFGGDNTSLAEADLKGRLSYEDLFFFSGVGFEESPSNSEDALKLLEYKPFDVDIDLEGSGAEMDVRELWIQRDDLLSFKVNGSVREAFNFRKLALALQVEGELRKDMEKLIPLFSASLENKIAIPDTLSIRGPVSMEADKYSADISVTTPEGGNLLINGSYLANIEQYKVSLKSENLDVKAFLPNDSIGELSLSLEAEGIGFDPFNPASVHHVDLHVANINYKETLYEGIRLKGKLINKSAGLVLESHIPDALLDVNLEGQFADSTFSGKVAWDVDRIELKGLGFSQDTTLIGLHAVTDFTSDLKNNHTVALATDSVFFKTPDISISYDTVQARAIMTPRLLSCKLGAGDFNADFYVEDTIAYLGKRIDMASQTLASFTQDSIKPVDLPILLASLPKVSVDISMGYNNPIGNYLRAQRLQAEKASLHLDIAPEEQLLSLHAEAKNVRKDTLQIDHIAIDLNNVSEIGKGSLQQNLEKVSPFFVWERSFPQNSQSSAIEGASPMFLKIDGHIQKRAYRGQRPFSINIQAETDLSTLDFNAEYLRDGNPIHKVELLAFKNDFGYGLSFKPQPIFLFGLELIPNPQNALFYDLRKGTLKSKLLLTSREGGEFELKSMEQEDGSGEKFNLLIRRIELASLRGITGIDRLSGVTFADILLEEDILTKRLRLTGDLSINNLSYNNNSLGNISTAVFYEPTEKSVHYVNAQVSHNGNLTILLDGRYNTKDIKSPVDAQMEIRDFALPLLNPFIGKENATVTGFIDGKIHVEGGNSRLRISGSLTPEAVFAHIPAIGEIFSLESKPIRFEDNKILLDEVKLRSASQKTPLILQGSLNLFNPNAMQANLRIRGDEVVLVDNKRSRGQILYGKMIVSPDIRIRGKLSYPSVNGDIDILGGTNLTYVYTGNKLKARNNMVGVVSFTDFSDTLFAKEPVVLPKFGGTNIALNLHIDPAVRLTVDLDQGHQDYISVQGEGNFRLNIPPFSEMNLFGSYDFSGGGEVRYEFPVVGRKTFEIDPSSSVGWNGNLLTPSIHFQAINRVRAEVVENKQSRKVDFDVLIFAKEKDTGYEIAFDLKAPNDLSLQNQLASMSSEERGKQAVAMMVSGSYLAGEKNPASMEKILSNLAVNELNNLTGKFLQGTDLNLGMELNDGSESGTIYTNYTYSFSKRFYNDRIRVVLGGKVAAGNLPTNYEQTFIDNVTLEYRLDQAGNRYLSLFHKRNNENLFEGLITETGISYLWRRKLYKISDIFKKHTKDKEKPRPSINDSLRMEIVREPQTSVNVEQESNESDEK